MIEKKHTIELKILFIRAYKLEKAIYEASKRIGMSEQITKRATESAIKAMICDDELIMLYEGLKGRMICVNQGGINAR